LIVVSFSLCLNAQENNHYYSTLSYTYFNNNAQSSGFGDINAVNPDGYYSSGLNFNPANLNNKQKVLGAEIFIPIKTDEFEKYNFGIYYSKNPKITLAYSFDNLSVYEKKWNQIYSLSINTRYKYSFLNHSLRASFSIKKDQFLGIGIKHIVNNILVGPDLHTKDWILKINILALDLGYYKKHQFEISKRSNANLKYGVAVLNIGPKVDSIFNVLGEKVFIPTVFDAGILGNINILGAHNVALSVSLAYQIDKFLVPSLPEYTFHNDSIIINKGYNPDVPYFKGIMQSFYDSPDGFNGELKEYIHKLGMEISINNNQKFYGALRFGKVIGKTFYNFDEYTTVGFRAGAYGFYVDFSSIPSKGIVYSKLCIGLKLNLEGDKLLFNNNIFTK
jgi:hypothetical protein